MIIIAILLVSLLECNVHDTLKLFLNYDEYLKMVWLLSIGERERGNHKFEYNYFLPMSSIFQALVAGKLA